MTLEELKLERLTYPKGKGFAIPITFKKAVVEYHYESGMFITALARELNIHFTTIHEWKRLYGTGQTHAQFGNTTKADMKTKALAVTDELENGMSTIAIANKYNITRQQYGAWKAACHGEMYKVYRELPDGVMYVTHPNKLIFGDKNIREYREYVNLQVEIRERILKDLHTLGRVDTDIGQELKDLKAFVAASEKIKDL